MKSEKENFDLRNSYVVLGSGPNALATIEGLSKGSKKISVIDAGFTSNIQNNRNIRSKNKRPNSPKFFNTENNYIYKGFEDNININLKNFNLTGSLAMGGLSNIWGGGLLPYEDNDLYSYLYDENDLKNIYPKMYELISGSSDLSDFENLIQNLKDYTNLKNNKLLLLKSLIAINKKHISRKICRLKNCDIGCASCNKGIFNSKFEFENLVKKNQISYYKDMLIKQIIKKDGYYEINCINCINNKKITYKASNIFCSLGTISTTKIVMKMINLNKELPLLSTPMSRFALIGNAKNYGPQTSLTNGLTFKLNNSDHITGNIFPVSTNLVESVLSKNKFKICKKLFGNSFKYFFIGNLFFPSNFSSNIMSFKDGDFSIKSHISHDLRNKYLSTLKILSNELKKFNYIMLPFSKKLLKPGDDIHYGGTLPIKENPRLYECNKHGELKGYENFFITDSSSLPFLPGKPNTFNSMCQSYMISKNFINKT
jgi:hypothetical protein